MDYETAGYFKTVIQKQPGAIICGESISGERFRVIKITSHYQGNYELIIKRSDGITGTPETTKELLYFDTLTDAADYLNYGTK